MTVHKHTAGDRYTYLTRQVAANDATDRGSDSLGDYYSAKGEAPGVWIGSGLVNVPPFYPAAGVSEEQMASLFGEGRHPNAAQLDERVPFDPRRSQLGAPYRTFDEPNEFRRRTAGACRDYNLALGLPVDTSVPAEVHARIRGELGRDMFTAEYDRPAADARELSGHLARINRQRTTAVAGYDLTFSPVKSVSTLWTIASREIAQIIELAHHDAVRDTISWLEANAVYTRRGRNGVRQVEVNGVLAAAFIHRDSRAVTPTSTPMWPSATRCRPSRMGPGWR